ncbi:MAG: polyketide synthase, partial [Myxococcota bacterium]
MRPPIAIVGWGCALPGALDPGALWDLVRTGAVAIGPTRDDAWGLDPRADAAALATQIASTTGGYVRGLPPDPTGDDSVAYATHAARGAVASAGLDPGDRRPRGAVILGNLGYPTRAMAEDLRIRGFPARGAHDHPRAAAAIVAHRLGFELGGVALDAACASSLVAIGLACDQLSLGDADVVLTGGVNASDDLFLHLGFTALGASSPTGRSRPFHRGADGLVPAHGAAVVVLERLDDALARRAPILGLVRGVGLANDGRTRGALVPDSDGQVRAIAAAHAQGGVDRRKVSYVECHATGTPTGDAVELASLARVFDVARGLPIGSSKANLGHALTAAGAAGVLKVLAMFAARELPPSPHADDPIDGFGESLRLVRSVERWESVEPLLAGVDAFGFGGNDAHVVLEAWEGQRRRVAPQPPTPPEPVGVVGWARAPAGPLEVDLDGLRLPPSDAELALPGHLTGWRVARDAIGDRALPPRTSVWSVFATDPLVARCGLRWRDVDAAGGWVTDEPLSAGRVLGCMANLAANRLNAGLDLRGPSGALAAGADSDGVALAIAADALARREVDAALVVGLRAAVVLRRLADARA